MADLSNILANGVIFSTLKHTDLHTVRGRPTLKDGLCNERIFRNGSFRELKIAKESNDLAKVSLESIKAGIFKSRNLQKRESLKAGIFNSASTCSPTYDLRSSCLLRFSPISRCVNHF